MIPEIEIGRRTVGKSHRPYIIAEIGINHGGDFDKCCRLFDAAIDAGASAVKIQVHDAAEMADGFPFDIRNTILEAVLTEDQEHELQRRYGADTHIIATPFCSRMVPRAAAFGRAIKIGSGELSSPSFVDTVVEHAGPMPVIASTGMVSLRELAHAVKLLSAARGGYALLHCVSRYPTEYPQVGLDRLVEIGAQFPNAVLGYSDHCTGISACLAAVAMGAAIIEKHFMLEGDTACADSPVSAHPKQFARLVQHADEMCEALEGTAAGATESVRNWARGSVVLMEDVLLGQSFAGRVDVARPGTGIEPMYLRDVRLGSARRDMKAGTVLQWADVKRADAEEVVPLPIHVSRGTFVTGALVGKF